MKKLILSEEEHLLLQCVLRTVPPAQLHRVVPDCSGWQLRFYRGLCSKVFGRDYSFPDTDDSSKEVSSV